ncbi:MAG: sodium:proton antiporter [Prevotella sp.]|nr:sodium:proton antiporter [Prevotella sp.]
MTLIIVAILLIAYLLIGTEHLTNVSKAAVAIFAGTVGWGLYICYGMDFVMGVHPKEYADFLGNAAPTSLGVKQYIAQNIFLKHVGRASEIVIFLLATMTIVEILSNNGCFDFIRQLLKTRSSSRMLWTLSAITFLLSANLDNLSTTVMMLAVMRTLIQTRRQRILFGSAIVIAANCGGALTVIGDPAGLVLWNMEKVTATAFSMRMAIPCLVAWAVPTWWIGRQLPERCDLEWSAMPYRGDDTRLTVWQRLLMLFLGIGGLWFIPTFHNITQLSPFLGALCVLAVLWIVDELYNRNLAASGELARRKVPTALQYETIQMVLYVMGLMLAVGVVEETGAIQWLVAQIANYGLDSWWLTGLFASLLSAVLENFATAVTFFSLNPLAEQNSLYWSVVAFASAIGGNVLCIGSMSGIALMKMERIRVGWYFRKVGLATLVGLVGGLVLLMVV